VDDLHINKEIVINKLISDKKSDEYLLGIIELMSSNNLRISGNSAYVFGTIAENEIGISKVIDLITSQESNSILNNLVKLLKCSDYECLMNSAGTIGTIVSVFFIKSFGFSIINSKFY
jgi:hypothetical protein